MSSSTSAPSASSWLKRLVTAQESGLVLVIFLTMAALTIFGGKKTDRQIYVIPESAVVQGDESSAAYSVTVDGKTTDYKKAEGWERRGARLIKDREVNRFLNLQNLVLLAKDASFIAIMAVGMTAIIVMGGIDLSVGSIYALAALLGAMALRALQAHWLGIPADGTVPSEGGAPVWAAVLVGVGVCCAVGAACGLVNGSLIVGLKVHPFIITLGAMAALRGVTLLVTEGQNVSGFPESFVDGFFKAEIGGVYPVPVFFMLAVAVAGHFVLTRLVVGRRVYAIGGNETAAHYAGVPVGKVKIIMYTLCGMLAGLSSCIDAGYLAAVSPSAGQSYELSVIAAAVIGGASLSGGRGSALGAVLGAILIQLITNAMIILEIDTNYTNVVMGVAIVLAVVLDQIKRRFSGGKA